MQPGLAGPWWVVGARHPVVWRSGHNTKRCYGAAVQLGRPHLYSFARSHLLLATLRAEESQRAYLARRRRHGGLRLQGRICEVPPREVGQRGGDVLVREICSSAACTQRDRGSHSLRVVLWWVALGSRPGKGPRNHTCDMTQARDSDHAPHQIPRHYQRRCQPRGSKKLYN